MGTIEFLWEHDIKERRKLAFVESGVRPLDLR